MKILVAGATGALGKQLVPRLVAAGHDVAGMTRSDSRVEAVRSLGASPVVADALEPEQVARAVAEIEPEVIVHQLTALAGSLSDVRHPDRAFALTDRLRTEGTDHLLAAGRAVGVRRFVAQSYAGWRFARRGGPIMTEEDPLDLSLPNKLRGMLGAIRHLEDAVTGAGWTEGLVLRYGNFYGPGTSMAPDGEHFETIGKRKFPLVGSGAGVWSFVHIEDAAEATVVAVERGNRGIYNIVDDEPAAVAEWLPALAGALGAKPPQRVPRWLGRLLAGEAATVMLTEVRGASNAKAKRELGWRPSHRSWREGFVEAATQHVALKTARTV
ncbi:MAG: NAD-dependent epimerase/dehydratase family protein [Actinomycetota bacterium]